MLDRSECVTVRCWHCGATLLADAANVYSGHLWSCKACSGRSWEDKAGAMTCDFAGYAGRRMAARTELAVNNILRSVR